LIEFFELKKKICGLNSGLHTCYANAITAWATLPTLFGWVFSFF
jgi:hypothetical protein